MQISGELIMRSGFDCWRLECEHRAALSWEDSVPLKTAVYMLFVDSCIRGLTG